MDKRMYTRAFNKMKELNDFVNEKGILRDDIVNIFQSNDGLFMIMYYENE